jgi:hypothetical protein
MLKTVLDLVTFNCFILTLLFHTWITITLYFLHSPVLALASTIFRLAFTLVGLPPGKQWMIAGWFFFLNFFFFLHHFLPNFVVSNCLVATILSHHYNSRTGSGETKVESHASSGTQPNQAALLLNTARIQPGSQPHQCVGGKKHCAHGNLG